MSTLKISQIVFTDTVHINEMQYCKNKVPHKHTNVYTFKCLTQLMIQKTGSVLGAMSVNTLKFDLCWWCITQNSSLRMVINTHTIYALENIFFLKSQACCINTYCIKNEKKLCCNGQLVPANNVALSNPFSAFFWPGRGLHYCSQSISCKLISTSLKIESKSKQKNMTSKIK